MKHVHQEGILGNLSLSTTPIFVPSPTPIFSQDNKNDKLLIFNLLHLTEYGIKLDEHVLCTQFMSRHKCHAVAFFADNFDPIKRLSRLIGVLIKRSVL